MPLPSFTTIVAVDAAHLPELAAAWPTWAKWRPDVVSGKVLFVVDLDCGPNGITLSKWNDFLSVVNRRLKLKIMPCDFPRDWPQRERMLTALVTAVEHVETTFYLKLDTDTIACGTRPDGKWWEDSWFEGGEKGPVIVASPWGYTKPASMIDACDEWWESFPSLVGDRRFSRTIVGNIAKHPRIISYAMWGRTDWTRRMWGLCNGRMPCPSQDTFLGYCAVRGGWPIIRAKQSKYGWQHCGSSLKRVQERAAIALNA